MLSESGEAIFKRTYTFGKWICDQKLDQGILQFKVTCGGNKRLIYLTENETTILDNFLQLQSKAPDDGRGDLLVEVQKTADKIKC